jgi:hypothetical protein
MKKKQINDLTTKEILVVRCFIDILEERKIEKDKLRQSVFC